MSCIFLGGDFFQLLKIRNMQDKYAKFNLDTMQNPVV